MKDMIILLWAIMWVVLLMEEGANIDQQSSICSTQSAVNTTSPTSRTSTQTSTPRSSNSGRSSWAATPTSPRLTKRPVPAPPTPWAMVDLASAKARSTRRFIVSYGHFGLLLLHTRSGGGEISLKESGICNTP
ncbi:hypothetical protein SLEP1_g50244 [Rubroshorea leprosula]|uniref:Secreted protein n=1 Tax=Rubroshorea leprosula TaxID=152421 RepID=A0AAV5M2R4_9ROSI|nr:hypothetical protein SLEP1_g50244 [Rubroshorea leprosula]